MDILGLRAFEDNYIWLLRAGRRIAAVDPGDAGPVLNWLRDHDAALVAILLTHHHPDHVGGVARLSSLLPVPVFGPAAEDIPGVTHPLRGTERLILPGLDIPVEVMAVPGHTRGHLAYLADGALFCGDTLFGCGCGRLFEGTAAQMHASLTRLADCPAGTRVYCAHEYTAANLRFALTVEPANTALRARRDAVARLRAEEQPTVPFLLDEERATNPFLRCAEPAVAAAAEARAGHALAGAVEVFATLREWRNGFR